MSDSSKKTSLGPLAALASAQISLAKTALDLEEKAYREKVAAKLRDMSEATVH